MFNSLQLIGLFLSLTTFLWWGWGAVRKQKGKTFQALPMLGALLITIGYHIFAPMSASAAAMPDWVWFGGKLMDALVMGLINFGIGLLINGIFLKFKKYESPQMHIMPGIIALVVAFGMFLFSKGLQKTSEALSQNEKPQTEQYLLELGADDAIEEVQAILEKYGASFERAFPSVSLTDDEDLAQYYLIYTTSDKKTELVNELLADKEDVDSMEPNSVFTLDDPKSTQSETTSSTTFDANDPFLNRQWFAEKLAYNDVYKLLKGKNPKRKAKLAILDTGVDGVHEDINASFSDSPAKTDKHGHGTHCAGLAGAVTNNKTGVGSLNWEGKYLDLKGYAALSQDGSGSYEQIAQAIVDAATDGADVISMSLGGPSPFGAPKVMKDAIKFALKKNAIVVVAAGNSNDDSKRYSPANIEGVICVAAVDNNFRKASFSNTNTSLKMPIAAPGTDIFSSTPSNSYASMNGTSMATPIVAGLLGIMKSFNPGMSASEAYKLLKDNGNDSPDAAKIGKTIQPLDVLKNL